MRALLNYAPSIIVFLAAIIGSLGPSRDASVAGLGGLTLFGWSMLTLASVSFCVAIYGVYSREAELKNARLELNRIRSVAFSDLRRGVNHLVEVLEFAVLAPYLTSRSIPAKKRPAEYAAGPVLAIDLKSDRTVAQLETFVLDPSLRLNAPYANPIPFGTDTRSAMAIIAEEAVKAKDLIDEAIQKYAARAITADVFEFGSELLNEPFLGFMINIREHWTKRSRMEDATSPDVINLRMIGSGVRGGSKADYLAMIDSMEKLRAALTANEA
jgi:hypothetical protein